MCVDSGSKVPGRQSRPGPADRLGLASRRERGETLGLQHVLQTWPGAVSQGFSVFTPCTPAITASNVQRGRGSRALLKHSPVALY